MLAVKAIVVVSPPLSSLPPPELRVARSPRPARLRWNAPSAACKAARPVYLTFALLLTRLLCRISVVSALLLLILLEGALLAAHIFRMYLRAARSQRAALKLRAVQRAGALAGLEGARLASGYGIVLAFLTGALAKEARSRHAFSFRYVRAVVLAGDKGRRVLVGKRATADSHERASVVVGKVRFATPPVQAAEPRHCEHVVAVGEDSRHSHLVAVRKAPLVRTTRWLFAAVEYVLHPAAVFKHTLFVPLAVM